MYSTEETLHNVMVAITKVYNRQRALHEFDSDNAKLIMAETLAALELLIDLYGPQEGDIPQRRNFLDGIRKII